MTVNVHPLTPDRWRDLEALFKTNAVTRDCWCMWFRRPSAEYRAGVGDGNRRAFQRVVRTADAPPGVLAYIDGKPVGWCAIAPREEYVRLARSRILKSIDDTPVWSITCFFIAKDARKQGVSHALLRGAMKLAKQHGAKTLEAYPVDPLGEKLRDDEAFHGVASLFEAAGFDEVARRSPKRPIVRRRS